MKILFALNQDRSTDTEEAIISSYKSASEERVEFKKEYDLTGVTDALRMEHFDIVFLNEEIERDNTITTTYIDDLTDKHPGTRIIMLVASHHEKDPYIKRLFNIGVYDLLYAHDISIDEIVRLMANPRNKAEAKEYLDLAEVGDAVVESELRVIPESELDSIISYLLNSEKESYPGIFEHIDKQYNDYQMMYLIKKMPLEIRRELNNSGSKLYLGYLDSLDNDDEEPEAVTGQSAGGKVKSDLFKIPQFNKRDKPEAKTIERTVEKIVEKEVIRIQKEKEYISIVPEDYKKVAAFTGSHNSGVTTIVDLIATEFSKRGKKVAVLDFSSNKSLYFMKCWGKDDLTHGMKTSLISLSKGKVEPIIISQGYHLFTVGQMDEPSFNVEEFNFYKALELIRYNYDIILLELDLSSRFKWLSFGVSSIYVVNDLNVVNMIPIKRNIKELVEMGVNKKKFSLIVNKYMKSKTKAEDMLSCITNPLPNLEYNDAASSIEINPKIFKVHYDNEFYTNHLESLLYVGDKVSVPKDMAADILDICQEIYPLDNANKGNKGLFGKLLPF